MSIWGSLIGGFVGFSFAGPIGALIGSMVGGRISSARRSSFQRSFAPPQQIFAIALIILTAKLAKADGQVSKRLSINGMIMCEDPVSSVPMLYGALYAMEEFLKSQEGKGFIKIFKKTVN